ncbi:protein phosphatase 2C domain-containing protein [uncultured Tateyamaria sp.]|uniref:PP2C family protein-serine/threonine phosphatase n=1 Tax=uncultured Tateyamaria sp. TaxID=455651 RepID=UPI002602B2AD|nr:protein phosphatase 2C domain-containing protein [uncultured Tateyamaria sp.]
MNDDTVTPAEGLMSFETSARTDVGRVRKLNEDSLLVQPMSGLWLVADGMGGHTAGDFASQAIVAEMETIGVPAGAMDLRARFMDRLTRANATIQAHAVEVGRGTIGATVAALIIQQDHFACIWSGDSRVYRMRGQKLTRVTRDHTEVQALLDAGSITAEQAESWPRKNVITRAIGVTELPECDMVEGTLEDGDLFLLCSDGLTEYFEDSELAEVLYEGVDFPLDGMCAHLVGTALARGGKDNVSVVIVRCHRLSLPGLAVDGEYPEFRGLQ